MRLLIEPPATIAVLGGGQLGRMFLQAAQRLGYRTLVLSATPDDPAAQIAHEVIIGPPDSPTALKIIAEKARAVTVEFENVSAPGMRWQWQPSRAAVSRRVRWPGRQWQARQTAFTLKSRSLP